MILLWLLLMLIFMQLRILATKLKALSKSYKPKLGIQGTQRYIKMTKAS